jgi:hypothetical protein
MNSYVIKLRNMLRTEFTGTPQDACYVLHNAHVNIHLENHNFITTMKLLFGLLACTMSTSCKVYTQQDRTV